MIIPDIKKMEKSSDTRFIMREMFCFSVSDTGSLEEKIRVLPKGPKLKDPLVACVQTSPRLGRGGGSVHKLPFGY